MVTTRAGTVTDSLPSCSQMEDVELQVYGTQIHPPLSPAVLIHENNGETKTHEPIALKGVEESDPRTADQTLNLQSDAFVVVDRRNQKRRNITDPSILGKVYPEYTINEIACMGDSQLREFVNETISQARCSSCKNRGRLIPVGTLNDGQATIRYWRCGGINEPGGCGRYVSQSKVVSQCMQAGKRYSREIVLPNELTTRISGVEISLSDSLEKSPTPKESIPAPPKKAQKLATPKASRKMASPAVPRPMRVEAPKLEARVPPVNSEQQVTPSISQEERERFNKMCDEAIHIVKDPKSSRDAIGAAAGVLEYLRPFMFGGIHSPQKPRYVAAAGPPQPRPTTYAEVVGEAKPNTPPRSKYPQMIQRISKIKDPQERIEYGFHAITKQKKAPISKRVIKTGQIENPILREQVAGSKFVYVNGITRQPIRNIKETFDKLGIDVSSIYDISFIGKTVCSILCQADYCMMLTNIINRANSRATVLEDFDPLKPAIFRQELLQAESLKSPVEFLIRRAAFSAVSTNNMVVATAFQAIIPQQYHQAYREEIAIIEQERMSRIRPARSGPNGP